MGAAEVILRVNRLKNNRLIRRISGIFDTRKLGCKSLQTAMSFPEERIEDAAKIISRYSDVIYSCKRNHFYNFWFTLISAPEESLEDRVRQLAEISRPVKMRLFPNLKVYKGNARIEAASSDSLSMPVIDPVEREVVRLLQEDLPLTDEPFKKMAQQIAVSEKVFFEALESLTQKGIFRRVAAFLPSRQEEHGVQILTVWKVPEEKQDETALRMAMQEEVQLCAKRPDDEDFPYTLHTILNLPDISFLDQTLARIEDCAGRWPRLTLLTVKEYKRSRMKFFSKQTEAEQTQSASS